MASNQESLLNKKNEDLSRDELIKKIELMDTIISSKAQTIRGQNFTIQTITAQNLAMRDLLEQVKNFTPGLFSGGKWKELKTKIFETLDRIRGR